MPAILTQTERNDELSVLLKSGWEMVENRVFWKNRKYTHAARKEKCSADFGTVLGASGGRFRTVFEEC